ncbi:hypothetical protein [Streptomyces sp. NPDC052225]|uniref:hypothetical protein n=1 Tax=Streptomyces sp. NPDC052225 TaxID=3154949 RepID=UPI003446221A
MATDGQELIAAALASAEDRVQQKIEAARKRRERDRQQREQRAAARTAGLSRRHAAKLRNLGSQENPDEAERHAAVTETVTVAAPALGVATVAQQATTASVSTTDAKRDRGHIPTVARSPKGPTTDCQPDSLIPNDSRARDRWAQACGQARAGDVESEGVRS